MADNADNSKKILMGRIGAAHGLRGQVRINSFTQDPLAIATYALLRTNRDGLTLSITKSRLAKNVVIAKFAGIDDRTSAEALNGVELYVLRQELPQPEGDEEFLHADLIGLQARLQDGQVLGEVVGVANYGAGDVLQIREKSGQTEMFAFTRAIVPEINLDGGFLLIVPPVEIEGEQRRQKTQGENPPSEKIPSEKTPPDETQSDETQ